MIVLALASVCFYEHSAKKHPQAKGICASAMLTDFFIALLGKSDMERLWKLYAYSY